VAVSVEIVALAEELGVLRIGHCGSVQAMGSCEVEALADKGSVGWLGGACHFEAQVWGELPVNCMEIVFDQAVCFFPKKGKQVCGVGRRICRDLLSDDRCKVIADDGVDFLDADEVSGFRIGLSFGGELDFVVSTEPGHVGFAGVGVLAEG